MMKSRKSQKGSAAIFVIVMLSLITIFAAASLQHITRASKSIDTLDSKLVAKEMASAGLEMAKEVIRTSQDTILEVVRLEDKLSKGNFSVTIEPLPGSGDFTIISTGMCDRWKVKLIETVGKE